MEWPHGTLLCEFGWGWGWGRGMFFHGKETLNSWAACNNKEPVQCMVHLKAELTQKRRCNLWVCMATEKQILQICRKTQILIEPHGNITCHFALPDLFSSSSPFVPRWLCSPNWEYAAWGKCAQKSSNFLQRLSGPRKKKDDAPFQLSVPSHHFEHRGKRFHLKSKAQQIRVVLSSRNLRFFFKVYKVGQT